MLFVVCGMGGGDLDDAACAALLSLGGCLESRTSGSCSDDVASLLPVNRIVSVMKRAMPPRTFISKDAKEAAQRIMCEFLRFLTAEACRNSQSFAATSVLRAEDLVRAIQALSAEGPRPPEETAQEYLGIFRMHRDLQQMMEGKTVEEQNQKMEIDADLAGEKEKEKENTAVNDSVLPANQGKIRVEDLERELLASVNNAVVEKPVKIVSKEGTKSPRSLPSKSPKSASGMAGQRSFRHEIRNSRQEIRKSPNEILEEALCLIIQSSAAASTQPLSLEHAAIEVAQSLVEATSTNPTIRIPSSSLPNTPGAASSISASPFSTPLLSRFSLWSPFISSNKFSSSPRIAPSIPPMTPVMLPEAQLSRVSPLPALNAERYLHVQNSRSIRKHSSSDSAFSELSSSNGLDDLAACALLDVGKGEESYSSTTDSASAILSEEEADSQKLSPSTSNLMLS